MTSQDDLALLKQMYQRGEISDEQYDVLRRHVLWGTPLPQLMDEVPPSIPQPRRAPPETPAAAVTPPGYTPSGAVVDPGRYGAPAQPPGRRAPDRPPAPGRRAPDPGGRGPADPGAYAPSSAIEPGRYGGSRPGPPAHGAHRSAPPADSAQPSATPDGGGYASGSPDGGGYASGSPDGGGYASGSPDGGGYASGSPDGGGYPSAPRDAGRYSDGSPDGGGYPSAPRDAGRYSDGSPDGDRFPDGGRYSVGARDSRSGSYRPGSDRPGSDRPGSDRPGSDRPGSDRPGSDRPGSYLPPAGAYPPADRDRREPPPDQPRSRRARREAGELSDADPPAHYLPPPSRPGGRRRAPEPDAQPGDRNGSGASAPPYVPPPGILDGPAARYRSPDLDPVDPDRGAPHRADGSASRYSSGAAPPIDPDDGQTGSRTATAEPEDELRERRARKERPGDPADPPPAKPTRRRRSLFAVLTSVVLALALVGAGVWWFALRTTGVAPSAYATSMCGLVRDWQQEVDSRTDTLTTSISTETDLSRVKTQVGAYYATLTSRTARLQSNILDAGVVDADGGAAYQSSFATVVGDQTRTFADLADRVNRLDPAAPATFRIQLQRLLTGPQAVVGKVSSGLSRPPAGTPPELRTALSAEPTCAPYVG